MARLVGGWTQAEGASRLGVSQPYYSQLESGYRPLPEALVLVAVREFQLSPVALPLPELDPHLAPLDPHELAAQLASLAYPGFAHLKKTLRPMNPAFLVAAALAHANLDPRLVEALPWVLAVFHDLDWDWLRAQCQLRNLQNRLAYVVSLAMKLPKPEADAALADALSELEVSRLAVEGTLCRDSMSAAERTWARRHRPSEAAHWNLLTTLTADQLTHAA
ncbi:MAG: helix-turn-helix transcriptional regulator [Acidobacteria bacterium]|nr:helix-turn-helix transcriptional regulator [Acidobacteriota bacterium]